jgi:hypothetical protein
VPELVDDYIAMVKGIMERHYHDVTRYTANTFLRMKLGEALEKPGDAGTSSTGRRCCRPMAASSPGRKP